MAVTNLTPKLSACFQNGCTQIVFSDNTLLYNASSNTGGWNDASTINNSAIDLATVEYKHSSEEDYTLLDVTVTVVAETITGEFEIVGQEITTGDGQYTFRYTITEGVDSAVQTTQVYSLCGVRCCIDKMWHKYISENSDCDCGCNDKLLDQIFKAESLYRALVSLGACGDVTTADKLLTKLQRICSLQNCNCSN